jgi:ABC-type Mn2+/Zn2+ transport system ATPase subunit
METLVRLKGAAFGYAGAPVIAGVDLTIGAGDFVGIVGPNGGGKTTLFRGMLGLVPALAGSVERATAAIGYVPQRESLDPIFPLRVEEVVQMGAYGRLRGWRRLAEADRRLALECLGRVGLAQRRREPFAGLSGGQRQRVLIARALMAKPRLLLLDEPTSGVDRGAQARVLALLTELREREAMAIVLVSHQLGMLRQAVQRVLWVADGRAAEGTAAEVLRPERLDALYASGDAAMGESA